MSNNITDRNSPLPNINNNSYSTPIGVPLYFDTQRKKRYIIPIRPAPTKDEPPQQQNPGDRKHNKNNNSDSTGCILHKTTATILVCGLPAIMSIPEMLHLLFYDDIVLENPNFVSGETRYDHQGDSINHHQQQTKPEKGNKMNAKNKDNNDTNNNQTSSFTIDHQPNLFFRFLNSIRVCFGSENGTLAMLVTFFNDEDDTFSEEKFTYSNAAAEFFARWHGKSAFSLSKEILTVDFVDMNELRKRSETAKTTNGETENEVLGEQNPEKTVGDDDDDDGQHQDEQQNLLLDVSPFWSFLQPEQKQIEHQHDEPCAICLDQVSFFLPPQQNSPSGDQYSSSSTNQQQHDTSSALVDPSLTTTEDFYTRLNEFSSLLQLPCQHLLHTSCFASVVGEAPCPLCRFNCCEEAFAATCSVCQQQEQEHDQQQQHQRTSNANNQKGNADRDQQQRHRNQNDLWICLVCGDCFCSKHPNNHREEHFLKDSTHHLFIQSGGLRIWDCHFDDYVHRVISNISATALENQQQQQNSNSAGIDDACWRDNLDWADDEAEIEANLLQAKMAVMENYYNDLLLEQLQAQEEHFVEKVKREGLLVKCEKFFSKERIARNHICSSWRQELKSNVQGQFLLQLKMRTRQLKGLDAKFRDEIEIQQVVLATANATKEKYKKFIGAGILPSSSAAVTSCSPTSETAKSSKNNTTQSSTTQPRKPTTLQEVAECIDKHPDVVALEKELEGLINELTSM